VSFEGSSKVEVMMQEVKVEGATREIDNVDDGAFVVVSKS